MAKKPPKPADQPSQPRTKTKRPKMGMGLLGGFPFLPPFAAIPPPKTISLSDLTKWPTHEETLATYKEASDELHNGTDRAAAIVGALHAHDAVNGLVIVHLARKDARTVSLLT